jgi:hypothetical protein
MDPKEFGPIVSRAAKPQCPEMKAIFKELNGALTPKGKDPLAVMLRMRRAIAISKLGAPHIDTSEAEAELNKNISIVEERHSAMPTEARLSKELDELRQERQGYVQISGIIVASLGSNMYEASNVTYSKVISIDEYYSTTEFRALIETTGTAFQSQGRFTLWAKSIETRKVQTKNGFEESWSVWKETGSPAELDRRIAAVRKELAPYQASVKTMKDGDQYALWILQGAPGMLAVRAKLASF